MTPDKKASKSLIAKEMTLGEVVSDHPECVETMLSYGLHCVGCHVAHSETIEEGAKAHGMSDEEVAKMVEELNDAVSKTVKDGPGSASVTLSHKAVEMIKSIFVEQKKDGFGLRITASPGGGSGFMYEFDFEKDPMPGDKVIEEDGVRLFIDQPSFQILKGSKIDYVKSLQGEGFRIDNPNFAQSCDCGDGSCE